MRFEKYPNESGIPTFLCSLMSCVITVFSVTSGRKIRSKNGIHSFVSQVISVQYFTSILLLNFNLTEVFCQVPKPLLSSPAPPQGLIYFDHIWWAGGGGVSGRNRPGGIFEMGVLFCLAKTMVSVLLKELKYKMDTPQVREVGGHAGKDQ